MTRTVGPSPTTSSRTEKRLLQSKPEKKRGNGLFGTIIGPFLLAACCLLFSSLLCPHRYSLRNLVRSFFYHVLYHNEISRLSCVFVLNSLGAVSIHAEEWCNFGCKINTVKYYRWVPSVKGNRLKSRWDDARAVVDPPLSTDDVDPRVLQFRPSLNPHAWCSTHCARSVRIMFSASAKHTRALGSHHEEWGGAGPQACSETVFNQFGFPFVFLTKFKLPEVVRRPVRLGRPTLLFHGLGGGHVL